VVFAAAVVIPEDAVPIHLLPQWQIQNPKLTQLSNKSGRIIGGSGADSGQFPYTVVVNIVLSISSGLCAGALIHESYVLTAANCLDVEGTDRFDVYLGAVHRDNPNEPGQVRVSAIETIIHEDYDRQTYANDIGLILIPEVLLSGFISTIPLADDPNVNWNGQFGTVSGWGRTTDYGDSVYDLQYVSPYIISNLQCTLTFGPIIVESNICTTAAACTGDSGAPLVADDTLIGIVSFNAADSCSNFPTAYSRVTSFREWISDSTGGVV